MGSQFVLPLFLLATTWLSANPTVKMCILYMLFDVTSSRQCTADVVKWTLQRLRTQFG
jgi:hypothetical protein